MRAGTLHPPRDDNCCYHHKRGSSEPQALTFITLHFLPVKEFIAIPSRNIHIFVLFLGHLEGSIHPKVKQRNTFKPSSLRVVFLCVGTELSLADLVRGKSELGNEQIYKIPNTKMPFLIKIAKFQRLISCPVWATLLFILTYHDLLVSYLNN